MKKTMVLGLVVLLVIGSAVAAHAKAQKADLKDGNGNTVGFVIFNNPDPADEGYNLTMLVSLKQGEPNVTYEVDMPNEGPEMIGTLVAGDLTTNRRGHGNLEFHIPLSPGLYTVLVELVKDWEGRKFYTDPVEILLKQLLP